MIIITTLQSTKNNDIKEVILSEFISFRFARGYINKALTTKDNNLLSIK